MEYLLDTHIILWGYNGDKRLSQKAREILNDENNIFYYGISSMWEIATKHRSHKDTFPYTAVEFLHHCEIAGFARLPIRDKHILAYENLPNIHKDPFDNILVSQAKSEGITLLTHDSRLGQYGDWVEVV